MSALQAIGERLWIVDGPIVKDIWPFETRMVVAQLSDGSLWVESPVIVSYPTLQELVALGPVTHLLASTPRHVWRLGPWHELFPEAQTWAPPDTAVTLKPDFFSPSGRLTDSPEPDWAADFDQVLVAGSRFVDEVVYLHRPSRTLIVQDLIEVHRRYPSAVKNALVRLGGVGEPEGGTPLDIRVSFLDRKAARASLERVLSWDFDKLVIAHGPIFTSGVRQIVENAFAWAVRQRSQLPAIPAGLPVEAA